MNVVSQWWIGGLRTRKAKVAGSIPAGGSVMYSGVLTLLNLCRRQAIEPLNQYRGFFFNVAGYH
jgi:hypothetical protein